METQVWMYPEEFEWSRPEVVAQRIADFGFDAVSIAVTYHLARRVFPRYRVVSSSPPGAVSFEPELRRYGTLKPRRTASPSLVRSLHAFRSACDTHGLRFRAWTVVALNERLAVKHPDVAAQTADGSSRGDWLCLSQPAVVDYARALVDDICAQFTPDAVDLEGVLYPSWESSTLPTIALTELSQHSRELTAQCFCRACADTFDEAGVDINGARQESRRIAASPSDAGLASEDTEAVTRALVRARSHGVARLVDALVPGARSKGVDVNVLAFPGSSGLGLQGLGTGSIRSADRVTFGLGTLRASDLAGAFRRSAAVVRDRRRGRKPATNSIAGEITNSTEQSGAPVIALRSYVGGVWRDGDDLVAVLNPARPAEVIAEAHRGDRQLATEAIESALGGFTRWRDTPGPARGEILRRAGEILDERAEAIGRDLAREEGKTLAEAVGETRRAASILRYFAGQTLEPDGELYPSHSRQTLLFARREPLGVVSLITPWNFPIAIPAWKIGPALAYGNTVVWKPAEIVPLTAVHLVEALVDAGLPPGVLNLVLAPAAAVGELLVTHGAVTAISFTGSNAVGRSIQRRATEHGKKVQLELGGKNPAVVLADADIEFAAEQVARGAFLSAGQKCTATSRVILERSVYDEFAERLIARAEGWRLGDPLEPETVVGPLASPGQLETVVGYLALARTEGATVLAGLSLRGARRWLLRSSDRALRPAILEPCRERGDLRSRRDAASGGFVRRGGCARERHAVWPHRIDLHARPRSEHQICARDPCRRREGQSGDGRAGIPGSVRRHEGKLERVARTGKGCPRLLHRVEDRLHRRTGRPSG
jgi:aldehyde dehydrogenase (NAD+)